MARLAVCPSPTFFRIMTADFCFRLSFNLLLVTKRTNSTGAYEAEFNMATPLGKTVRIFVNALRLIQICVFILRWRGLLNQLEWLKTAHCHRPTVLFADWSIAYYENSAGRLLGHERGRMVLTATSSACNMHEEGRFTIREGSGRDMVALSPSPCHTCCSDRVFWQAPAVCMREYPLCLRTSDGVMRIRMLAWRRLCSCAFVPALLCVSAGVDLRSGRQQGARRVG